MQEINSTQKKNISGKLIGAVILLLLGVVLALAYPSKQSQRAVVKPAQVSQAVKKQAVQETVSHKQIKKPKIKKRQVPAVIQEEEEGC